MFGAIVIVPFGFNVKPDGTIRPVNVTAEGITATPFNVSFANTDAVVAPTNPLIGPKVFVTAHIGTKSVTVEPVAVQLLSVVERTLNVYVPGATPVKVALDWYVVPLMLYSTPDCVVNTIVPVVVAHVGWTVTLPDGVLGALGAAFTVTVEPVAVQLLSVVERTLNVYVPGATPVKVALDWYVVPLMLYSTPDCVVNTIVPVVVAHVGWTVTLPDGLESVQLSLSIIVAIPVSEISFETWIGFEKTPPATPKLTENCLAVEVPVTPFLKLSSVKGLW